MTRSKKQAVLGCICGVAFLAQAAVSWGTALSTEAQIDSITINSSLGITFGDIFTSASGKIYSDGSLVASDSASGAGSFTTGVDGSVGPLPTNYTNLEETQFAFLGTTVVAPPSAATSNPLLDDFVVLGNSVASSLQGGKVTATDTATYSQTFTINGTGSGTLSLSAFGLYNFNLFPDGIYPFTVTAEAWLDFYLTDGSGKNLHVKVTNPSRMIGADKALLGYFDPLSGAAINGDIFGGDISVLGGDTYTFTAIASTLAEVNSPAPVPEPSTFLLLGAGIAGLAFYRRRKSA